MWLTVAVLCSGCVSAVNALTGVNVYGKGLLPASPSIRTLQLVPNRA